MADIDLCSDDLTGIDPNAVAKRGGELLAQAWLERDNALAEVVRLRDQLKVACDSYDERAAEVERWRGNHAAYCKTAAEVERKEKRIQELEASLAQASTQLKLYKDAADASEEMEQIASADASRLREALQAIDAEVGRTTPILGEGPRLRLIQATARGALDKDR